MLVPFLSLKIPRMRSRHSTQHYKCVPGTQTRNTTNVYAVPILFVFFKRFEGGVEGESVVHQQA